MWVAEVPSLPGCYSQGADREAALRNVREAIDAYIEVLKEKGEAVPPETFEVQVCVV